MLSHPITRDQDNGNPLDGALAEMPSDVKSSMERLEQRLEDSESHVQELQGQLHTANGRFDDFSQSMFERLQEAEEAKLEAESAAQATQQELIKWQGRGSFTTGSVRSGIMLKTVRTVLKTKRF